MYSEKELLKAISDSFKKYKEHGARSTEKVKPLHKYIACLLKNIWGEDFQVDCCETKEIIVGGKYYPKRIDVTVTKKNKPVFCVGIKFVTSNYKQNANNYFENMMGETANIQAATIPYAQLIILRYRPPYYKKNETETLLYYSGRGLRGGSFNDHNYNLASSARDYGILVNERGDFGFRIASVPEPATLLLLGIGAVMLRKHRK